MRTKVCSGCKEELDLDFFFKDSNNSDLKGNYCKSCNNEGVKRKNFRDKMAAFRVYSNSIHPSCECCGEDNVYFLTLDHVNNDGAEHRRTIGQYGQKKFYQHLKNKGYPKDPPLRVLCMNCNFALGCYGFCPHKQ